MARACCLNARNFGLRRARSFWSDNAIRRYLKAVEQGHAEAQLTLGGIYTTGKVGLIYTPGQVVARDPGEAVRWYRRAAEQGDAEAQQILGIMYAAGRGVAQDDAEALRWQLLAAEQGTAREQFLLGLMYARGRVVPKDHEQAMEWFGRSAEQGVPFHPEMTHKKAEGLRYDKGRGARQHNAKVVPGLQNLAESWHTRAQFNLGTMYADGLGVPQDHVQAHMWFNLAASRLTGEPRENAVRRRDDVAGRMTPDDLSEAQRLAREWDAAHPYAYSSMDQIDIYRLADSVYYVDREP